MGIAKAQVWDSEKSGYITEPRARMSQMHQQAETQRELIFILQLGGISHGPTQTQTGLDILSHGSAGSEASDYRNTRFTPYADLRGESGPLLVFRTKLQ